MKNISRNLVLFAPEIYYLNNTRVCVESSVIILMNKYKQMNFNQKEACGILMCSITDDGEYISINNATTPQSNDIRKKSYFFLKDKSHQVILDELYSKSSGTIFLCGTWHTHAEDYPKASSLDIKEWKKFVYGNKGLVENFYFIIAGKKDISLYTYINDKIKLITKD